MNKKAFITGVAGQDGLYLAELLYGKGYEIHGLVRDKGSKRYAEADAILQATRTVQHTGDVTDAGLLSSLIADIRPHEIYHLAGISVDNPVIPEDSFTMMATNFGSAHHFLSIVREHSPKSKFFFASSSRIFGAPEASPQNEQTPYNPNSLYGIAKTAATHLIKMYREKFGLFACSGILFSHESPRRREEFVTRKIAKAAVRISLGLEHKLALGNLETKRDWGFAGDYIEAMWRMLRNEKPGDYVIGTGETHSIKEFAEKTFSLVGLSWKDYVIQDKKLFRPLEKHEIVADFSKARQELQWIPQTSFSDLVAMMILGEQKIQ